MPWNRTSARLHRKHRGPGSLLQNISHCKLVTCERKSRETGSPRKTLRLRGRTIKLKTIIFSRVMKSGSRAEDNTELRWNMTKAMWSHTVALTHQSTRAAMHSGSRGSGVIYIGPIKPWVGGFGGEGREEAVLWISHCSAGNRRRWRKQTIRSKRLKIRKQALTPKLNSRYFPQVFCDNTNVPVSFSNRKQWSILSTLFWTLIVNSSTTF